jgi:hypothetical protein
MLKWVSLFYLRWKVKGERNSVKNNVFSRFLVAGVVQLYDVTEKMRKYTACCLNFVGAKKRKCSLQLVVNRSHMTGKKTSLYCI